MKQILLITLVLFCSADLFPQDTIHSDLSSTSKILPLTSYYSLRGKNHQGFQQGFQISLIRDSTHGKYGNLTSDDPAYNIRYSWWKPALEVLAINGLTWVYDRYIINADYANIGINTWKHNIKYGWEWDTDKFGVNFIGHPVSGAFSFNAARTCGYNYLQSVPFVIGSSLTWEYFGENTLPSYNDFITTPVNGSILGEILYRVSSEILDDRTKGSERVFREIFAGIINPVRGINRLIQGKSFRITDKEVYQKEPMKVTIDLGAQVINDGVKFATGSASVLANLNIQYGDPFEHRKRKPFDYFENLVVVDNGDSKNLLDNVSAYGLLSGKNSSAGKTEFLTGVFQHYDYFNNKIFELGAITLSGGMISKTVQGLKSSLMTHLNGGLVPFSGYSIKLGPDTSLLRDYNFGGGFNAQAGFSLNLGGHLNVSLFASYFFMRTYSGLKESNLIGIIKPRITIKLVKNMSMGFEYFLYTNDRIPDNATHIDIKSAEQKLFISYSFGKLNYK